MRRPLQRLCQANLIPILQPIRCSSSAPVSPLVLFSLPLMTPAKPWISAAPKEGHVSQPLDFLIWSLPNRNCARDERMNTENLEHEIRKKKKEGKALKRKDGKRKGKRSITCCLNHTPDSGRLGSLRSSHTEYSSVL